MEEVTHVADQLHLSRQVPLNQAGQAHMDNPLAVRLEAPLQQLLEVTHYDLVPSNPVPSGRWRGGS